MLLDERAAEGLALRRNTSTLLRAPRSASVKEERYETPITQVVGIGISHRACDRGAGVPPLAIPRANRPHSSTIRMGSQYDDIREPVLQGSPRQANRRQIRQYLLRCRARLLSNSDVHG